MFVNMFEKNNIKKSRSPAEHRFLTVYRDLSIHRFPVRISFFCTLYLYSLSAFSLRCPVPQAEAYSFLLAKSTNLNLSGRWRDSVN